MDQEHPSHSYPAPSSCLYSYRHNDEPLPSPVSSQPFYDNGTSPEGFEHSSNSIQHLQYDSEKEDDESTIVELKPRHSKSGISHHRSFPKGSRRPRKAPMSPISEVSLSAASVSAVSPTTPFAIDRPLTALSILSLTAVSEDPAGYDIGSIAGSDYLYGSDEDEDTETEPASWAHGDDLAETNLSTRERIDSLYAVSASLGHTQVLRTRSNKRKPTRSVQPATAPVFPAPSSGAALRHALNLVPAVRQTRDSISEARAEQEKLVLAKHPFAAQTRVVPAIPSSQHVVPQTSTQSLNALLKPTTPSAIPMATSRSDTELATATPRGSRPILMSTSVDNASNGVDANAQKGHRVRGHSRALTTIDVITPSMPRAGMPNPPFSAPPVPSRHRLSFQDASSIAPVPTHTPSNIVKSLPVPSRPQRVPLTVLTTNFNSKPVSSPTVSITTRSPLTECGSTCCFLDFSDNEETRPLSLVKINKLLGRRRSSPSSKDRQQGQNHHHTHEHSHKHEHVHTLHQYHYNRRVSPSEDIGESWPTVAITPAVPATRESPNTTPNSKRATSHALSGASPHIHFAPATPRGKTGPLAVSPRPSPQYILPPSELPARRKRHVPPPLDLSLASYQSFDEYYITTDEEFEDDEDEDPEYDGTDGSSEYDDESTPRTATQANHHSLSSNSAGSMAANSRRASTQLSNDYDYAHSFRRAHRPHLYVDEDSDDSEDSDERLVLDTPFEPSEAALVSYERDGFRMPTA